jgi:hypothetical protein
MPEESCPFCGGFVEDVHEDFQTGRIGKAGTEIIVKNVLWQKCNHRGCGHSWLPAEEEKKIDDTVSNES